MIKKIQYPLKFLAIITVMISSSNTSVYAQNNIEQNSEEQKPIIVVGQTLDQSLKNLNDCLKRNCPPDQDINASLAHAENLFIEGEYKQSSRTIKASLKRNKKHAAAFPIPVSDLYRSNSRVLEHLGEIDKSNFAVLKTRDVLKKNLSSDQRRILVAEMGIANAHLKDGATDAAIKKYKKIYKAAIKHDLINIAGFSKLSQFNIKLTIAIASKKERLITEVRQEIIDFYNEIDNPENNISIAIQILWARADRELGSADRTDELIKYYARKNKLQKPLLIHADPIDLSFNSKSNRSNSPLINFTDRLGPPVKGSQFINSFDDRWVDIGFFVSSLGRVEDIEVLRISGKDNWLSPVFESIQSRIYAPRFNEDNTEFIGQYIVERYSLTSKILGPKESTIRRRSGVPIVRRLDLTVYDD